MAGKSNSGLASRLADVERDAHQLADIVKGRDDLPELLRSRLHVDIDTMAAKLARHRLAIEAAGRTGSGA